MTFTWHRGATAYELQVGRLWFRFVHLRGEYWQGLRFYRRFEFRITDKET